jgi:hypothetical protein
MHATGHRLCPELLAKFCRGRSVSHLTTKREPACGLATRRSPTPARSRGLAVTNQRSRPAPAAFRARTDSVRRLRRPPVPSRRAGARQPVPVGWCQHDAAPRWKSRAHQAAEKRAAFGLPRHFFFPEQSRARTVVGGRLAISRERRPGRARRHSGRRRPGRARRHSGRRRPATA